MMLFTSSSSHGSQYWYFIHSILYKMIKYPVAPSGFWEWMGKGFIWTVSEPHSYFHYEITRNKMRAMIRSFMTTHCTTKTKRNLQWDLSLSSIVMISGLVTKTIIYYNFVVEISGKSEIDIHRKWLQTHWWLWGIIIKIIKSVND